MNNNIKNKTILTTLFALVAFTLPYAFAETYHTGYVFSSDASHSDELDDNGSIPFAFTSNINSLTMATDTDASELKSDMNSAIITWNSGTDVKMHRDDTTTYYFDNTVTGSDLSMTLSAKTQLTRHLTWTGYDSHIIRAVITFNNDSSDIKWDHDGDSSSARPVEKRIYNTMLHELGHTIGLCGTYNGDNQSAGACTTVTTTDSAMSSYVFSSTNSITSGDQTEVNGKY